MKKSILTLLAGIALVACGKTDPEPSPKPQPENPKPEAPINEDLAKHYIAKVERYGNGGAKKTYDITYTYDSQKRLSSFVEKYYALNGKEEAIAGRLSYQAHKIRAEYDEHKSQTDLHKPTEYLVELDATTGRAKRFVETLHFTQQDVREEKDYTFNTQGKQTSYTSAFVIKTSIDWVGDTATKVFHDRNNRQYTEQRGYGDTKNNIYPDLNLFLQRLTLSSSMKYLWSDELGLRSDKLMSSYQLSTKPQDKGLETSKTFVYEFDRKGRPQSITVRGKDTQVNSVYRITYLEP